MFIFSPWLSAIFYVLHCGYFVPNSLFLWLDQNIRFKVLKTSPCFRMTKNSVFVQFFSLTDPNWTTKYFVASHFQGPKKFVQWWIFLKFRCIIYPSKMRLYVYIVRQWLRTDSSLNERKAIPFCECEVSWIHRTHLRTNN